MYCSTLYRELSFIRKKGGFKIISLIFTCKNPSNLEKDKEKMTFPEVLGHSRRMSSQTPLHVLEHKRVCMCPFVPCLCFTHDFPSPVCIQHCPWAIVYALLVHITISRTVLSDQRCRAMCCRALARAHTPTLASRLLALIYFCTQMKFVFCCSQAYLNFIFPK